MNDIELIESQNISNISIELEDGTKTELKHGVVLSLTESENGDDIELSIAQFNISSDEVRKLMLGVLIALQ